MSRRTVLSVALLGQVLFFSMVLVTVDMPRTIFFGLFWVATLTTLLAILSCKRWYATEWIAFGAFSSAMITAVLLSSKALVDTMGVSVPVLGLLFIAAIIAVIPDKKRVHKRQRVPAQQMLPNAFYVIPGSAKYHRKNCRMLNGRQELQAFMTEKEVRALGKSRCNICF